MELSSHNWMRPESLDKTFKRLADCNYDSIELSGLPDDPEYQPDNVRRLMDKYKIRCWGAVTLMVQGKDLISHRHIVRRASIRYVKDCVDMVAALDGKTVTVVPGEVGKIVSISDPADEWRWGVAAMKEIADHARQTKVRIGIEPLNRFETCFINNHKQALLLAEEAGPDVGVCLDAFHMNIEEELDLLTVIRNVGKKLTDFHVADTNRRPPGQGRHDWDELIEAIRATGYEGALTNEVVIPTDRTPVNPTTSDEKALEGVPEAMRKFYEDHAMAVLTDAEYEKNTRATAKFIRKYLGPKRS